MSTRLTFVHALSPLHAGTGQGVGVIDLPIAREKATGLPFLPGSSLKGPLKSQCDEKVRALLFGKDSKDIPGNDNSASTLQFSDQRLLLLPIRSLAGTFARVTSPYILRRLVRDMKEILGITSDIAVPQVSSDSCVIAGNQSKLAINGMVYLEDLDLKVQTDPLTSWAEWIGKHVFPDDEAWQGMLTERMCVVADDTFSFLIETATEITARIKLQEDSKTVQKGGLWYEEALPTETILSGVVQATPTKDAGISAEEAFKTLDEQMGKNPTLQFGGKATVGRGLCRLLMGEEGK